MADETVPLKKKLQLLYNGRSEDAKRFRFALLAFDVVTLGFFVISSMMPAAGWINILEFGIGLAFLADLCVRFWISEKKNQFLISFTNWADVVVIATLLLPVLFQSFLFLRVLRALRLLRSYHVLRDLRNEFSFFRRNEELIESVINLSVFVFVLTALVFVLQVRDNPNINNYIDALYFTVTTLTTTGFGDITLEGSTGRLLAVIIMVVGVALFLRLIQTIFRPNKIRHRCPDCGLKRHDPDAVHCKHCGNVLDIETEGSV